MKKINQIVIALIVLMSTIGFASATMTISPSPIEVNVISDAETIITVKHTDNEAYMATGHFSIFLNNGAPLLSSELQGTIDNGANWGSIGSSAPHNTYMDGTDFISEWTFKVKDNGDANDNTQVGTEYDIYFESENSATTIRGSATSDTTAVPEFPTIALPVAAILGLAFFFQRRREED